MPASVAESDFTPALTFARIPSELPLEAPPLVVAALDELRG